VFRCVAEERKKQEKERKEKEREDAIHKATYQQSGPQSAIDRTLQRIEEEKLKVCPYFSLL
jgi:hypothetical protein